ncbi:MAG: DUF2236 domain-containing protein [Sandaracinus sp.]|nr:DUF2236 domain-containing protein [Sandaracinus sp.]
MEPTEFRYWSRIDEPAVRTARALAKRLFGFDPAPSEEVVRTFASMYYDADPLAEAFVDECFLARSYDEGRALLERALAEGVDAIPDAPASLRALFADLDTDPAWVDRQRVARGARVFRRWGTSVFRFAGAITLAAYTESSVAKPLALTGAYAGSSTRHRFLETASFWIDVSEPEGLEPGAAGRAAALRVRIMHVFVRRRLLGHPEWNLEAWGVPISQADALLTLMGGSVAPGIGLHAMGFRTSTAEIEDAMHFWRYVGHLMGVRPRWFPSSVREGVQLAFLTFVKSADAAGDDGKRLCQSYVDAFTPTDDPERPWTRKVADTLEHGVHRGYTRLFLPPHLYRKFELPPAGIWALHPIAWAPVVFAAETLRRRSSTLDRLADQVARRRRRRWLDRQLEGKEARFEPVRRFQR